MANSSNSVLDLMLGGLIALFLGVMTAIACMVAFGVGWCFGRTTYPLIAWLWMFTPW